MKKIEENLNDNQNNKENNTICIKYVSLRDFILFKEDFLKSLGDFKKEINGNLTKEQKKFDLFVEKASNLISTHHNNNNFITKLNFIEEKNEIISQIKKLETDINNQLMINKLNLSTYQKDLSDACFKYDKIISENLLIAGLIGPACEFPTLKDYILNNKEKMSINYFESKKNSLEIKEYKNKLDNIYEQLKYQIMTMKNNYQAYIELKIEEFNKKFEEFTEIVREKVGTLNLANNSLVENLKEQENKMLEGMKFIEMLKNETIESNIKTSKIITKSNKNYINQFIQAKNEFKSMKKNVLDLSLLLTKKDNGNDKNKKTKEKIIKFLSLFLIIFCFIEDLKILVLMI